MKGVSKYSCIEAITYQEDLKHISSSFIFWKKITFDQISCGQHSFHQQLNTKKKQYNGAILKNLRIQNFENASQNVILLRDDENDQAFSHPDINKNPSATKYPLLITFAPITFSRSDLAYTSKEWQATMSKQQIALTPLKAGCS